MKDYTVRLKDGCFLFIDNAKNEVEALERALNVVKKDDIVEFKETVYVDVYGNKIS